MKARGRTLFIVSFLAPAVLLYAGFVVWPLIQAFSFSTVRWSGLSNVKTFVGLGNFTELAHDGAIKKAIWNNLMLLAVGGSCTIALSIAIAHGLQGVNRVSRLLKSIVLFPQIVSLVAVAVLWQFLYNPQFGLLTSGLNAIGLHSLVHTWLGEPQTALGSVGVAFVWYSCGFYTMLFSAALKSIPGEVTEAASLDGASGWKRFVKVTWPMLWSVKRIAIIHLMIAVMNVFTLVFLMTQGGPSRSTETLLTYLYETAFQDSKFGYATAIAVTNFALVMVLSAGLLFAFRRNPEEARA